MAKKETSETTDTEVNIKYPMGMWDFFNNVFETMVQLILIVLCTPVGWVGILIIGFVYMWITAGALPI